MKKINKLLTILLVGSSIYTVPVYANEPKKTNLSENANKTYSIPIVEEINNIKNSLSKNGSSKNVFQEFPTLAGGEKIVYLIGEKQVTNYFCGPSAAQSIEWSLQGRKTSQYTIANIMGTTPSEGTYVYRLVNYLNDYATKPNFRYAYANVIYGHGNYKDLFTAVKYSNDLNMPVVFNVNTEEIGLPFSSGHYVVGKGYSYFAYGSQGYSEYEYFDPYDGRIKRIDTAQMEKAIRKNGGYYIW